MEQNVEAYGCEESIRCEVGGPEEFRARVLQDYDRNYVTFFGLGTAAAGWVRHWCYDNCAPVPSDAALEEIACRLLGWQ